MSWKFEVANKLLPEFNTRKLSTTGNLLAFTSDYLETTEDIDNFNSILFSGYGDNGEIRLIELVINKNESKYLGTAMLVLRGIVTDLCQAATGTVLDFSKLEKEKSISLGEYLIELLENGNNLKIRLYKESEKDQAIMVQKQVQYPELYPV